MVRRILCCKDVPARNAPVERGLEEDAAFADRGVDVAEGFDGVGCRLAGGEAGDLSCTLLDMFHGRSSIDVPYRRCRSWNWWALRPRRKASLVSAWQVSI